MRSKGNRFWMICAFLLLSLSAVYGLETQAATLQNNGKSHDVVSSAKGEYHTLKVKKSSLVCINAYGSNPSTKNRKITVTCLNRKKRAISPAYQTTIKKSAYFCLKPGTYYLKVKSTAPAYKISAIYRTVKNTAGSSMKKAIPLKDKKETWGIVYNTDSTKRRCWYRFSLKKPKKVQLSIQKAGGRLGFEVEGPAEAKKQIQKLRKGKKVTLPAGNYFIKLGKQGPKAAKDGAAYCIILK